MSGSKLETLVESPRLVSSRKGDEMTEKGEVNSFNWWSNSPRNGVHSRHSASTLSLITTCPSSQFSESSDSPKDGEPLLVMKFGGSSLATLQHLRRVASIVSSYIERRPLLVLSAMGKTTDLLLASAQLALKEGKVEFCKPREVHESVFSELKIPVPAEIIDLFEELGQLLLGISYLQEISPFVRDRVVSFGERLSIRTFTAVFNHLAETNLDAKAIDSWEAGMITTGAGTSSASSTYSRCEVTSEAYTNLNHYFAPLRHDYAYVPVVTGYIAKDTNGTITTLGRDGSDISATILGAAIQASEVQVWKDVDGVMTTDPRVIDSARKVDLMTFEEASELSAFGSKVVHPSAILPAWKAQVPMSVRNSLRPDHPGTQIVMDLANTNIRREGLVAALSSKKNIVMVVIRSNRALAQYAFLAHLFKVFKKLELNSDVINISEATLSLTIDPSYHEVDLAALQRDLQKVAQVELRFHMAQLTAIARKKDSSEVLHDSLEAFEKADVPIEMVCQGASNVNVTFIMEDERLMAGTRVLHECFFGK